MNFDAWFHWLKSTFSSRSTGKARKATPFVRRYRPWSEILEDRATPALSFAAVTNFAVGTKPVSVAVGDFNGDGKPDLATANKDSSNLSVLLGTGTGNFGAARTGDAGTNPESVTVGDFNGDGKPDLAEANSGSDTVSVLLGVGDGGLGEALAHFGVGVDPLSVTVGDFNGDGKLDLATANSNSNNVSVLLGDGAGSFGAATNFAVGENPYSVTVGDFNGDGKPDLAAANSYSDNVSVLLGDGAGSFGAATNFGAGSYPFSVTVGDFDGDGKPDLATANFNSRNVSVLLGDGTGSFAAAANFDVGTKIVSVTVGDFNGDGKSDLATANFDSNNVSVLLGDGTGSFAAAANFDVGTKPVSLTVGDFNGDGKPDLATANSGSNDVSVLLNTSANEPTVTTPTSANIASTTATLGGNVTSDGGAAITERGVVYALTSANANPQIGGTGVTKVTATGTTGVFTTNATGLTPGAGYSFFAYATNSAGTTYTSPVSTFSTLAVAPTVTTPTSTNVASTTATLGGNVTSDGGATITERGVVYALTSANANPQIGGTGVTKVTATGTTGVFTTNATGLTPGAGYSFFAYATNSVGTTYTSPVSTFSTLAVAPTVTTPTSANIATSTATLGGNVTSDGGATITERGVVLALTSANANPQIGGTGVTKVTATGTTGVFTTNATGLTQSGAYSFAAYATNSAGTTYTSPVSTFTMLKGDDFNGPNTPNLGANWTQQNGAFSVSGNQAKAPAAIQQNVAAFQGILERDVAVEAKVGFFGTSSGNSGVFARYTGPNDTNMYYGGLVRSGGVITAAIYKRLGGAWSSPLASIRLAAGVTSAKIRFEVIGTKQTLTVFGGGLNGADLKIGTRDTSITGAGKAGIRGNQACIDDFLATPLTPAVAPTGFMDDFTGAILNSNSWTVNAGSVSTQTQKAVVTGTANLVATLKNTDTVADAKVEAAINLNSANSAGLVARHNGIGDSNMYWGSIVRSGSNFVAEIWKNVNGTWTKLTNTLPTTIPPANATVQSGLVRFEVVGTSLKLFVNNVLKYSSIDSALLTGSLGIRGIARTSFDDFKVL